MSGVPGKRAQHDEEAERVLVGYMRESSENDVVPVTLDLSDEWLERFPCEESVQSSAVASTPVASAAATREKSPDPVRPQKGNVQAATGFTHTRQTTTSGDGRDEPTPVAAVATARVGRTGRRFRPTLYVAGISLAVVALVGLIWSTLIRVGPSVAEVPVLESRGTVAIGRLLRVRAPSSIEHRAPIDTTSVIDSAQKRIIAPAGPVFAPSRPDRIASVRPTTPPIVPPARTPRSEPTTAPIVPPARARSEPTTAPIVPPARTPRSESPPPTQLSASNSPEPTPRVPPTEPLPPVPAAEIPRVAQPEPAAQPARQPEIAAAAPTSAEASGVATDRGSIQHLLNEYQNAFNSLNASAAKTLWPSVDERALGRAFDQLRRQELVLDACQTAITGHLAVSSCRGRASYVPKVGNRVQRIEAARWTFKLRRADSGWIIEGVESR
jgi:hypothetical protein